MTSNLLSCLWIYGITIIPRQKCILEEQRQISKVDMVQFRVVMIHVLRADERR